MDGRARALSNTETGLLWRQLASITDTLAKALRCRLNELQRKAVSKMRLPPAIQNQTSNLSTTSRSRTPEAGGASSMQSADSVSSRINQMKSGVKDFGLFNVPSFQSKSVMDGNLPVRSIREGHVSTDDEDDPKKMLAQLEQAGATVRTLGKGDSEAAPAGTYQAEPVTSNDLFSGAREMLGDMLGDLGQTAPHSTRRNIDGGNISPAQMRADFERKSSAIRSSVNVEADVFDSTQLLAEIQNCLSALGTTVGQGDDDDNDDPKAMLAVIEARTSGIHRDDHSALLEDAQRKSLEAQDECSGDRHTDLEALHSKLTISMTSVPDAAPNASQVQATQPPSDSFDKPIIPYVIALQLERAGLPWEQLRSWTTYLFSSGLDGYEACRKKEQIVKQAEDQLNAIIKQALGDESYYLAAENLARLPCRLVVSNIAAGAEEDDLKEFFWPLRYQIQELKMLLERDPIKRTKIAQIEFHSRETAIRASYLTGSIFGLLLDIQLVVEKED